MRKRLTVISTFLLMGCGGAVQSARPAPAAGPVVRSDATLGRVVVYRNGVAYFERYAKVSGDTLRLAVPADKVDDFLKSLTVVDARTGRPTPVVYPTDLHGASGTSLIDMAIALSGPAPHELRLSYVTESPSWKPSYRVVMRGDGEVDLQAWAIVDNTSGEDWKGVRLGVGSSAALSFRVDLLSIHPVKRETLHPNEPFALVPQPPSPAEPEPPAAPPAEGASTDPVGTASFESTVPMTVPRGASAMVSMLNEHTQGEIAYLYDLEAALSGTRSPASPADPSFPVRAVRLRNPTDSVLDAGPISIFGESRLIGEAVTEPIPAGALAFVPFALDREVVAAPRQEVKDELTKILGVQRGVFQTEVRHALHTTVTLQNRRNDRAVVYVRHTLTSGFRLSSSTPASDRLGDAYLFRVALEPHGTTELAIEEEQPLARTADARAPDALDQVEAFLVAAKTESPLKERVEALLARAKGVKDDEARAAALQQEVEDEEERQAQLEAQLAALKAAHAGDALAKDLQAKKRQLADREAKAKTEIAAIAQKLLVARIDFQDAVAELTLPGEIDAARASND